MEGGALRRRVIRGLAGARPSIIPPPQLISQRLFGHRHGRGLGRSVSARVLALHGDRINAAFALCRSARRGVGR